MVVVVVVVVVLAHAGWSLESRKVVLSVERSSEVCAGNILFAAL